MSRLTKYFTDGDEYGYNLCHGGCESCNGVLCGNALEMIKKLAHYEDLEEQGRLVEVKQGEWAKRSNDEIWWYECSICSGPILKNGWGNDMFSEFCPHCGAKMDEVKE